MADKETKSAKQDFSIESVQSQFKGALSQTKDYSPFLFGLGKRALVGAAWGGLFGFIVFRGKAWRKASVLYGAGFGLGMCAPAIMQLREAFFDDNQAGTAKDLSSTPNSDQEFYQELDSIKHEIVLRNKFKH